MATGEILTSGLRAVISYVPISSQNIKSVEHFACSRCRQKTR